MSIIRTSVTISNQNAIPRDAVENAFVFDVGASALDDTLWGTLHQAVVDFYNSVINGRTHPISWYLSPSLSRAADGVAVAHTDITTHLDGSPAGSPAHRSVFQLGAPGAGNPSLPDDIACCVSYHGAVLPPVLGPVEAIPTEDEAVDIGAPATHQARGRLRSRHLGRIYIGPLNRGAEDSSVGSRPEAVFITNLTKAAGHLAKAFGAGATTGHWSLWSRRNAAVDSVTGGWVDNRWDAQRRRRAAATARTLWVPEV